MKTITIAELARRLGVSHPTVSKIASNIPGQVRIGRRIRFREDVAMDFFANGGLHVGHDGLAKLQTPKEVLS